MTVTKHFIPIQYLIGHALIFTQKDNSAQQIYAINYSTELFSAPRAMNPQLVNSKVGNNSLEL